MNYIVDSPANKVIRTGDICIIYISEHNRSILRIEEGASLQSKFGLIKAADLVNHPYGVKFNCKKGWVIPLRLTPESWTQLLPHRTQILYQADISMILLQLDVKPGSLVVESGTGSGSLSHAILRACLPNGFLYTFDINESRVKEAQKEFEDHGLSKNVQTFLRNVCEEGYGDELEGKADACILDLPQTWSAIEHAYKVLKPDGSRLCTFSPCIEQVQQNVAKMTELKLKDIMTVECLLRPFEAKTKNLRIWNDEVLDGLVAVDQKRIENLMSNLDATKRPKLEPEVNCEESCLVQPIQDDSMDKEQLDSLNKALTDPKAPFHPNLLPKSSNLHARQYAETVSHSGYLTFASKRS